MKQGALCIAVCDIKVYTFYTPCMFFLCSIGYCPTREAHEEALEGCLLCQVGFLVGLSGGAVRHVRHGGVAAP